MSHPKLLKVPLQSKDPQLIYQYLEMHVGQLYMLVKKGFALVNFKDENNNLKALEKAAIQHFPFSITPYKDGDLENLEQKIQVQQQPDQFERQMFKMNPQTKFGSKAEKIINKHKKNMIDFIKNYNILMATAKQKLQSTIIQSKPNANYKFSQFLKDKIEFHTKSTLNLLKSINIETKKKIFKRKQPKPNPLLESLSCQLIRVYQNKEESTNIKRIMALDQNKFICTYHHFESTNNQLQKIKIYHKNQNQQIDSFNIQSGAYGLMVIGQKVLISGCKGSISFFMNKNKLNMNQIESSPKLHKELIFDIINLSKSQQQSRIATLELNQTVKIWSIEEEPIMQDLFTLNFKEQQAYKFQHQTMAIDALSYQKFAVGSREQVILFNADQFQRLSSWRVKHNIQKIKRVSQNLLVAANSVHINLVDCRTAKMPQSYTVLNKVTALCPVDDRYIFYGDAVGCIGLFDLRMKFGMFSSTQGHKSKIYDISRVGDDFISGDQQGILCSWRRLQDK